MQVLLHLGGDLRTALPNTGQFQNRRREDKCLKKKVWISKITFLSCQSLEGASELTPVPSLWDCSVAAGRVGGGGGGGVCDRISMQCTRMGYLQGTAAGFKKKPLCWEINSQYAMNVQTG